MTTSDVCRFHDELDAVMAAVLADPNTRRATARVVTFASRKVTAMLNMSRSAVDVVLTLRDIGDALESWRPDFVGAVMAEIPDPSDPSPPTTDPTPDDDAGDDGDKDDDGTTDDDNEAAA